MKIGFISTTFPVDLQRSVFGLHKRMGMFIHAMKEMGELDMLFFVPPRVNPKRTLRCPDAGTTFNLDYA